MGNLFEELKRRHVFRVGVAYLVVGWLLVQVADTIAPMMNLPEWAARIILFILMFGFPVVLILAWAYDVTPEGVMPGVSKAEKDRTGRRSLDYAIFAGLVVAVGYFAWEQQQGTVRAPDDAVVAEAPAQAQATSIAVLPFADLSPEGDQEYFSDGISEELLNVLVKVDGLRVASRTSAFAFKGKNRNLAEIADVLNVSHILEGSVRKAGNRIRVTAQLIEVAADRHLWSQTYDRDLTDIFAIQDDIANAIVAALRETLGIAIEKTETVAQATENMDAYDLYLKAASRPGRYSAESVKTTIAVLEQAVGLDPDFARAWAQLATVKSFLPGWDYSVDPIPLYEEAEAAAEIAVGLDPLLGLAHTALGRVAAERHDWTTAFQEMNRAVELAPREHLVVQQRGLQKLMFGDLSGAIPDIASALLLDPKRGVYNGHMSFALLALGRREEALKYFKVALEHGYFPTSYGLTEFYLANRQFPEAAMNVAQQYAGTGLYPLVPHINRLLAAPTRRRGDEIRRFWSIARELGLSKDYILGIDPASGAYRLDPSVLLALEEFELLVEKMKGTALDIYQSWLPSARPFRQSEPFRNLLRESGIVGYWRAHGWPDLCRPLGDDDFECD